MPTFIQATLPTTRLKTLSKRSHASSQPVTSAVVPILLSGTQVGRSTSATPDTTIETASSSESKTGIPASLEKQGRAKNLYPSIYSSGPFFLGDSGVRLSGKGH